jgi:hypothetical protein
MAIILPQGVMPMRQIFIYLILPIEGYNTQGGLSPGADVASQESMQSAMVRWRKT